MKWFAFQRGVGGRKEPCVFADEPPCSVDWRKRVISGTLLEVPRELEQASLEALATWAHETS